MWHFFSLATFGVWSAAVLINYHAILLKRRGCNFSTSAMKNTYKLKSLFVCPLLEGCNKPQRLWDRKISSGSSGRVRGGGEKHEIYAGAFGSHLFYDLFSQGMAPSAPPLDPLLKIRKNVQHNSLQSHLSASFKKGIYISKSRSYSSIVFDVFIEQTLCKLVVWIPNS